MISKPEDLLRGYVQVSSLPVVYTRINEAVNNPRSSTSDISKIISDDPGLTSRLLRLVNSAFYGYPNKIDTISRALLVVGTQQLRELALATSVITMFEGISGHLVNMECFWRHSIACGITAKILSTYMKTETHSERFFVAGIVHDIGRLILFKKRPDQAEEALMIGRSGEPLFKAEQTVLGFDHADIGRRLLVIWNIPAILQEIVAFHHNPEGAGSHEVETAVIHVADIIAHGLQLGNSGEYFVPPLNEKAWEMLDLPLSILPPLIEQVEREVNEVQRQIFRNN
ncbi:MAG: HDOD domain-containing protein [Syntrophales bacterium]|nr:HDOD domain-containing protein [Syntrophales bacterium]MDD5233861.1 HDOD domain-containing protein [Syntrophales bacterium]HPL63058.1 HDOD domain-containing protein [Syntrophales bacterium]